MIIIVVIFIIIIIIIANGYYYYQCLSVVIIQSAGHNAHRSSTAEVYFKAPIYRSLGCWYIPLSHINTPLTVLLATLHSEAFETKTIAHTGSIRAIGSHLFSIRVGDLKQHEHQRLTTTNNGTAIHVICHMIGMFPNNGQDSDLVT